MKIYKRFCLRVSPRETSRTRCHFSIGENPENRDEISRDRPFVLLTEHTDVKERHISCSEEYPKGTPPFCSQFYYPADDGSLLTMGTRFEANSHEAFGIEQDALPTRPYIQGVVQLRTRDKTGNIRNEDRRL